MSKNEDSKFTPSKAEALLKGSCKISDKVITVGQKGLGLKKLSALDYLVNKCGTIVKFERISQTPDIIPANLRGVIILEKK